MRKQERERRRQNKNGPTHECALFLDTCALDFISLCTDNTEEITTEEKDQQVA